MTTAIRYVVIDQDGQLHERTAANYIDALAEVGPEGWNRVRLAASGGTLAGFANDCGHVLPDKYRRNVVGSCMLVSTGAHPYPYAGPIVFTGWDPHELEDIEVRSLTDEQVGALRTMWRDTRVLLRLDEGRLSDLAKPRWQAAISRYAESVVDAPTPAIQILTDDEALNFLRGRR
jgi:hypothetical protein